MKNDIECGFVSFSPPCFVPVSFSLSHSPHSLSTASSPSVNNSAPHRDRTTQFAGFVFQNASSSFAALRLPPSSLPAMALPCIPPPSNSARPALFPFPAYPIKPSPSNKARKAAVDKTEKVCKVDKVEKKRHPRDHDSFSSSSSPSPSTPPDDTSSHAADFSSKNNSYSVRRGRFNARVCLIGCFFVFVVVLNDIDVFCLPFLCCQVYCCNTCHREFSHLSNLKGLPVRRLVNFDFLSSFSSPSLIDHFCLFCLLFLCSSFPNSYGRTSLCVYRCWLWSLF